MKTDIKNRADIEKIVNAFYVKIKADADISYFFNEVAKVNWEDHLPKMYGFFENILFFSGNYEGNPMETHRELNKKSHVSVVHFNKWNDYFSATVDELYIGKNAEEIKERAKQISAMMMHKAFS